MAITAFGSLQTANATRATEYSGGERVAMYEFNWREWEVTRGTLDSTKTASHISNINNLLATGFKVTLGMGLHYKPTWYNALGFAAQHKINQYGDVATGQTNMVFSQTARDEAARFVGLVNAVIPLTQFHAIRITSGDRSEVMYPENIGTYQYSWWGFDPAAQGSADLAVGQTVNPWPGWVPPATKPGGATNVGPWITWYVTQALMNVVEWQEALYDSFGFKGWYHLVVPGAGVTPNVWTAMQTDANLLTNNLGGSGAVWERVAALAPRKERTGLMSSSVANSTSTAYPVLADTSVAVTSTTMNAWTAARRIRRFAYEYNLRTIGENAGWGQGNVSSADSANTGAGGMMDRAMRNVTAPGYEFDEYYFAHSGDLFNGNIPSGAAAYAGYISAYLAGDSPVVPAAAPFPWTRSLNAEEGTNGATISTGTTTLASAVSIGGTSTATYANDQVKSGTLAYKFIPDATSSGTASVTVPLDSSLTASAEFWVRVSAQATSNHARIFTFRNSGGTVMFLLLSTAGKILLQNSAGTGVATSTVTIAPNVWWKIRTRATVATSTTGSCGADIYDASGTFVETMSGTATNMGTTPIIAKTFGKSNPTASGNTPSYWFDEIASASPRHALVAEMSGAATSAAARFGFIAAMSGAATASTSTLTVTLGGDVQGIEPYTTRTLTANASSGLATFEIEQSLGPTVLISGVGPTWTYRTPGVLDVSGAQLRFRVTATLSGSTATDEVDHFVYPNCWGYYTTAGQLVSAEVTDVPAVVGPPPTGDDTFTDLWVDTF